MDRDLFYPMQTALIGAAILCVFFALPEAKNLPAPDTIQDCKVQANYTIYNRILARLRSNRLEIISDVNVDRRANK